MVRSAYIRAMHSSLVIRQRACHQERESGHVQRYAQRVQPVPALPESCELFLIPLWIQLEQAVVDGDVAYPGGGKHPHKTYRPEKRAPEPGRPAREQQCHNTRDDRRTHPNGHDRREPARYFLLSPDAFLRTQLTERRMNGSPRTELVPGQHPRQHEVHRPYGAQDFHETSFVSLRGLRTRPIPNTRTPKARDTAPTYAR